MGRQTARKFISECSIVKHRGRLGHALHFPRVASPY
jgi:hypothetical protein